MGDRGNNLIKGMSGIVNPDNVKPRIDIKALENEYVNAGLVKSAHNPAKIDYIRDIEEMSKRLNIDMGFSAKKKVPVIIPPAPTFAAPDRVHSAEESESSSEESDEGYDVSPASHQSAPSTYSTPSTTTYSAPSMQQSSPREYGSSDRSFDRTSDSHYTPTSSEFNYRTQEQLKREHIDNIITEAPDYSLEFEKRADLKMKLLSTIDTLTEECNRENIDISRIATVDDHSTFDEVNAVHKRLQGKIDHTRYCTFAEEGILSCARMVSEVFDGKKLFFGKWRPDLTGWHNQVNVKLRRMRPDTSQIVGDFVANNQISPMLRILIELLPNAIIYASARREQYDQPNLLADDEIEHARIAARKL